MPPVQPGQSFPKHNCWLKAGSGKPGHNAHRVSGAAAGKPMPPGLLPPDACFWARGFVVRTVFPWAASRYSTPIKLQFERRVTYYGTAMSTRR